MDPADIRWELSPGAHQVNSELRLALGAARHDELRAALKQFIVNYFDTVAQCDERQGKSIAPVRCGVPDAKGLKIRFGYPGCGKSGGLRLAVLAFCSTRVVKIAGAWHRREDPDDDDLAESFRSS